MIIYYHLVVNHGCWDRIKYVIEGREINRYEKGGFLLPSWFFSWKLVDSFKLDSETVISYIDIDENGSGSVKVENSRTNSIFWIFHNVQFFVNELNSLGIQKK